MKIAILSCFYPFRGGIAQFNANLLAELGKCHEVRAFNFIRQYPSFLFPGKTQYVTDGDEAVPVSSLSVLDTANPFNWPAAAARIREWNPDILIMRYWMSYFGPSLGYVARHMRPECRVIAITDNIIPHEQHFFDKPLTRYFLGGVDGCVALCSEVEADLLSLRPDARHVVLPHPVYTHFGERIPKAEAERQLGIPSGSRNLLFFGLIREYKGLDLLIEAFSRLGPQYRLIIAGEPYGPFEKYQKLIDSCPDPSRVHVFPKYISDSEVKTYFSAADVAVLPYRSATQSGISAVADNFELPMIVTDVGGLRETIGERGTGLVCREGTPECIASEIERFFDDPGIRESCVSSIRDLNERLSWNRFCRNLLEFADTLKSDNK